MLIIVFGAVLVLALFLIQELGFRSDRSSKKDFLMLAVGARRSQDSQLRACLFAVTTLVVMSVWESAILGIIWSSSWHAVRLVGVLFLIRLLYERRQFVVASASDRLFYPRPWSQKMALTWALSFGGPISILILLPWALWRLPQNRP